MAAKDRRIDAYIAKAPEYARPILTRLRETVHAGCPDVEETLKWSSPAYVHHGLVCITPAFKKHAAIIFWKGKPVFGDDAAEVIKRLRRLTSIKDLPAKRTLVGYVKRAAQLNETKAKAPAPPRTRKKTNRKKPPPRTPSDLAAALRLRKHAKAAAFYKTLPPSAKRDYTEWITGAKRDDTRQRRLASTLKWLGEGKRQNWKYLDR